METEANNYDSTKLAKGYRKIMETEAPKYDAAKLTRIYRKIRDAKATAAAEYKKQEDALNAQLEQVSDLLLAMMSDAGTEGFKTEFGSVSRVVKQRFWSTDWDAFKTFVKDNDALDLFENRIAQKNMAQWILEHDDVVPPSLQIDRKYSVLVVKPRDKA
ncbi:MAG: hypothetical protein ACYC1K_03550 [Minisyncoccota bacterium]